MELSLRKHDTVTVNGTQWSNPEVKLLKAVAFAYCQLQSAVSRYGEVDFSTARGLAMDVKQLAKLNITDDVRNAVIKTKVVPFLEQVLPSVQIFQDKWLYFE